MKKLIAVLSALLLISCTAYADWHFTERFSIFAPDEYRKMVIDGTVCFQKPLNGDTLSVICKETELDISFSEFKEKMPDVLAAFVKLAKQGDFLRNGNIKHDLATVPYTIYQTSANLRLYSCFPGDHCILGIIVIAPLDCDIIKEADEFIQTIYPRLKSL